MAFNAYESRTGGERNRQCNCVARRVQRTLLLTADGRCVRDDCHRILDAIESDWARGNDDGVTGLRVILEELGGSEEAHAAVLRATEPYPDRWRAKASRPETLPHHLMILHRGGCPDGS